MRARIDSMGTMCHRSIRFACTSWERRFLINRLEHKECDHKGYACFEELWLMEIPDNKIRREVAIQ